MSPATPVVLIVDDDALIRRALSGVLAGHGFATAEATTVAAVVLDLTLDLGESGLDYLVWLRRQPTHASTPILILTGRPTLEAGDQDLIKQYRAYVFYKPVSMTVLADFLTRLVAKRNGGALLG